MKKWLVVMLVAAGAVGCGDPFRDPKIEALGGENPSVPPGPDHRPGQPCVLCHSAYEGAQPELAIGGSIFHRTSDGGLVPVGGYYARITDSDGVTFDLPTSCASGNFFLPRDTYDPAFPLVVSIVRGEVEESRQVVAEMESRIGRDGSCAGCHFPPSTATDVGDKGADSPGLVLIAGPDSDFPTSECGGGS